MKLLIQMVWVTVGTCLWWSLGSHSARVGTSGTTQSPWEARLSLLFLLPTTTTQATEAVVHNGSLFSGATSVTPVADQSAKCRTLLNEGINCTSVSGEAVVASETVSNEADDDESLDNNTPKNSDGRETVDTSRLDPSIVFDRAEGKRQFPGQGGVGFGDGEGSGGHALNQAAVRPGGSNPGSGGVSSRITGSSPEAAVSMVQSFVEDMINRPDGGRPGYVMINSPNPAIIQQLVAALTQRYGSSSVVQDAGAIQDLTGSALGDSRIQTPNASSSAASSDMPVFPFESRWGGPSSEVPVDPEVDYIRQQLASIAHVSVSTGKLVNDTLVSPPATPKPADATVVPSLPIVTQTTDDHTPTQGYANHNHQQPGIQTPLPTESIAFHSEELQDLNDEFSSQDLTPDGQSALNEGTGQQVEDVNDDIQHLLDDEGHKELYHSETSDTNSIIGEDYLTLPQDTQQESEYMTRNLTHHRHTHLPPTDKNESVVISSLIWNASPPDVINRPTNNAVPVVDMSKHQTAKKVATETSTIIGVLGEDSTSGSPDTSKYDVDITPSAVDEGSTTGYEDYYEEIDGELVLSPTKFMRKGNPAVTSDYVSDEDYHEAGGGVGHQAGEDRPLLLQHSLPHQVLTDWALAPYGVAESESASILRPHNPSLFPITLTGDVLEEDINEDPFPSQSTNPVLYNGNTHHEAADLQGYPNSHFHVNPRFPSNQNFGDDNMRQGLPPLYQNYDITPPRPSSADLEGYTDGPVQSGSGGSFPANPYLLEELWGMEKDSVRLSVLQELDRIPVVYEDEDLVTSSTILRALLSSDALDQLARMDEGDLATLGLLDHVQAVGGSPHENGYMAVHPVGEGSSPGADSSTQTFVDKSRDQNTTSGGVSEELKPPPADGGQNVSEGELAEVPVRSSFSSGNYRQSDVNMAGQVVHPVPPDFFPRRPTEAPHPGSGHHHGSDPPQLTPEQQGIIERLPEGMRHVVSSIVLAVQAPSSLTPTSTTTTSRPQRYPYPYPYPYPPYPYFPPPPPTYTYPYPPRPADFDGSSGSGHHHLTVHGAPEVGHGILTDHGVLHGPHDGHGVPHGPHDGHGVPHGPHDGHGVLHGPHDGHGVLHGPHDGHGVLHGPHDGHGVPHGPHDGHGVPHGPHDGHGVPHGPHDGHGVLHGPHDGHGVPHGPHDGHGVLHGPHDGHGVLHGPHDGHGVPHGPHDGHGVHSSGVTGDNHGSHSAHGHHGTHGTQSGQIVPANHGNAEVMEAHHGHISHRHGGHHGNHGNDRDQNEDLGGGAAEDGITATPSRLVTSTALRGTPRPAVLTHSRSPGVSSPALPVVTSIPSLPPNYNPDAIGESRLGEFDASGLEDISETGVRDNDNKRGSINRVGPSQPDRNQGLLNLRRDPAQMGHGRPSGGGFVSYRPQQQQTSMHMGAPVVNVVLPEATTRVPAPAEKEIGPLIDPREDEDDEPVTKAPQTMNREQVNSLLQSLFSSPTLLLMGIVFAASAAYMAIAMEEQAAQQNFQQAQLAAAFGGQPFPPGRRRRRRNLSSRRLWHPRRPQFVDLDH